MLKYEVALTNVFWDINDINTRHFESITQQNEYFDNLTGGYFSPLFNFNMGDNIETAIIYRDTSGRDISDLVKCNYLVLHKKEDDEIIERRYYFAMVEQDSGTQVRVTLSLDDIQTNYFKYKNTIAPCMINRTHINRFRELDNDNVEFNLEPGSPLFDAESEDLPKRLTSRNKLEFNPTNNTEINNWLKNNVKGWVYIFLDLYHGYDVYNPTTPSENKVTTASGEYIMSSRQQDVGCICYPIYKSNGGQLFYRRVIWDRNEDDEEITYTEDVEISERGKEWFRIENANSSYFFTSKFSIMPPFKSVGTNYVIENNNLYFIQPNWSKSITNIYVDLNMPRGFLTNYLEKCGVLGNKINDFNLYLNNNIESDDYNISNPFSFTKSSIIGSVKNINLEPKLLSQNYTELQVKSSDGQTFIYDKQKIGQNTINFLYSEPIQPEVTKYYCRLKAPVGLYSEDTDNNYLGLLGSNDMNISIANDQYSNFIANNKNFNLQTEVGFKTGLLNTLFSFAKLDYQGAVAGSVSNLTNVFNRLVTIDNLKASPGMLKNAMGNVLFNLCADDIGIYIEEYDALEEDKIKLYDYLYTNGYAYGHIGDIDLYDHTRKYFNYLECDVGTISAPISNREKIRLRDKLKSIRFWHTDYIDYSLENYERWLENG